MDRRHMIATFAGGLLALARGTALTAEFTPYEASEFTKRLVGGDDILIQVYAERSPLSVRQALMLRYLASRPAYQNVAFITVDFDKDKQFLRDYAVKDDATVLIFRNKQIVSNTTSILNPDAMARILKRALPAN